MSATQGMDIDSRDQTAAPKRYVVDPSKMDMTKPARKRKYYSVRRGHQAGIYYSNEELHAQIDQYPGSQFVASKSAEQVEEFMNHLPDNCHFEQCAKTCREAKEIARQRSIKTSANADSVCDCCGSSRPAAGTRLCRTCLANPAAYVEVIVQRNGLIPEQAEVLEGVAGGENAFITGSVGTGKSKLLKAMVEYFKGMGSGVTAIAPMGLAATAMGGQTLQMFMRSLVGWDSDVDALPLHNLTGQARQRSIALGRPVTDILILDDVNMMDSHKFSRLSMAMSAAVEPLDQQKSQRPFGGAQIIVCADFFKLPPLESLLHCIRCVNVMTLSHDGTMRACESHGSFALDGQFAFCSSVWQQCRFVAVELMHLHRGYSAELAKILHDLRWTGGVSEDNMRYLQLGEPTLQGTMQNAVVLRSAMSSRSAAADHSMADAESLPDEGVLYSAVDDLLWDAANHPELGGHDTGRGGEGCWHFAFQDHEFEHGLRLKLGMPVILVADIDPVTGLTCGRSGRIVAWGLMGASTLPKAQDGQTDTTTAPGKALRGKYRHYQELQIKRFAKKQLDPVRKWPIVKFSDGTRRTIYATCLVRELEKSHKRPDSLISRTQIPLIDGSNLSLHHSQNLTLDKVTLQLRDVAQPGEAYVAFSRVRSLDDLVIESLPDKVTVSEIVQDFMTETFRGEPVQDQAQKASAGDVDVDMMEL